MRRELEQKLVERWPSWFEVNGDPRKTRIADGFVHGDGWFAILWRLCVRICSRSSPKSRKRPDSGSK
jgi:hypothetical protein